MTMEVRLPISLLKDSVSKKLLLPKGWVYAVEDVSVKTEVEVTNPSSYLTIDAPLTWLKRKHQLDDQSVNPYCQHHQASNTTEAPPLSHSVSKRTVGKHRCIISELTSMPQIPL
jgi:hypothetical protein